MLAASVGSPILLIAFLQPQNSTTPPDENGDGLDDWARIMVECVCCTVAVLGGIGNLLTLCAVPYASRCCRAPLEVKRLRYSTATVFILNLAVADLLYCLVNLPLYYSQYANPDTWRNSTFGCQAAGLLRYTNAAADWMSLAGIAFNRCICLLSFKWKGRIFGGWKSYVIILLIWLYGFLTQGLSMFGLYGGYGWSNETHKCDFLNTDNGKQPRSDWFLISWSIPCVIIVVSYSLIFIKVKQSGRSILRKNNSMSYVQALVKTREDKTSRMIFVVFITYCVCVLPITVVNVADPTNCHSYLSLVFYCIYWLQYCCNNVIYVISNSVYRQAYSIFLTAMCPPLKRFLHQPTPWQPRQSTVTTIGGGRSHSTRSFAGPSRRLRHDSLASQTISADSPSRDGLPSSPSSQPTGTSDSVASVTSCATRRQQGAVARRLGPRQIVPAPRRSTSLGDCGDCGETERRPETAAKRPRLAGRLRRHVAARRNSLPLERKVSPLPGWWALDDTSWRWFLCDTPSLDVSKRMIAGSERRRERRTLLGRKRSMSF